MSRYVEFTKQSLAKIKVGDILSMKHGTVKYRINEIIHKENKTLLKLFRNGKIIEFVPVIGIHENYIVFQYTLSKKINKILEL